MPLVGLPAVLQITFLQPWKSTWQPPTTVAFASWFAAPDEPTGEELPEVWNLPPT